MRAPLVDQPTAAPVRKLKYSAAWGLLTASLLMIAEIFAPRLSGPVGDLLSALDVFFAEFLEPFIPVIVSAIAGYFVRARARLDAGWAGAREYHPKGGWSRSGMLTIAAAVLVAVLLVLALWAVAT